MASFCQVSLFCVLCSVLHQQLFTSLMHVFIFEWAPCCLETLPNGSPLRSLIIHHACNVYPSVCLFCLARSVSVCQSAWAYVLYYACRSFWSDSFGWDASLRIQWFTQLAVWWIRIDACLHWCFVKQNYRVWLWCIPVKFCYGYVLFYLLCLSDRSFLLNLFLIQTWKRFKITLFIRTKTQSANFWGNPLLQATKRH